MDNTLEIAVRRPVFQERKIDGYPQMRDIYAFPCVTLTVLITAYASYFSYFSILALYAMWLTRTIYKGRFILRPTSDIWAPLALAALSVASIAWSNYPEITAKPTLEGASMTVCSIIAARIVSLKVFVKGLVLGCALVLIASLMSGHYGGDAFSGTYSLIGLFGSKNEIGVYGMIGVLASLLHIFDENKMLEKIILSVPSIIICLICLVMSRSATSYVALAATLGICGVAYLITRMPRRHRMIGFIVLGTFAALAMLIALILGAHDALLHSLGKDTTLTGRTFLWAEGLKYGIQHPILGTGFGGFWVPGQPLAEKLWFKFGITGRTGFHFHNVLVQTFVDLGLVGVCLVAYMLIANCVSSFRYILKNGASLLGFYALGFSFMFFIRDYAEVDLQGTFGIGPLLFYSILPRLAAMRSAQNDKKAQKNKTRSKTHKALMPK